MEEGDFRGAIRLVCSEDSIAELDEVTLAALQSKHPPPHPNSCISPVPEEFAPTIQVSEEEIAHAISSFPNGSSGEPDGLRPQHLKNLISTSAERGGRELLRALTSFVNLVLDGKTPPSARPFFFGATLIPLGKKGGGIRPIAVGHTLRRLVAKCASSVILPSLGNLLAPLQLGCGTPMGCEAMVHAARQFVHNLIPGQMLLKLDFKNTFNCLRRDKMLMTVRESIPELFRFVHSAYAQTSSLFCTDQVVEFSKGVQQGDPLGPMLFCLTIHPMVEKLRSELKVFYLDDGTLGGNLEDIIRDLQLVEKEAAELGLQLNRSKSELLCEGPTTRDQLLKVVPGLQVIGMDQVEILGSPVGSMT
ncbi:MAG: reverse transcriptase domain-containing protein, partial [Alphaproteobacteria bacterium]|nr:reverse transcriptase domain-containing protein [Alphaproteobacteria bacterium]